ncbi:MAG: arsenate reductase family protein [Cyclobacteriaceae bacterium]
MKFHPNELFLYFDPSTTTGKQTRAIAHSLSTHVNEMDYRKVKLTTTIWKDMLDQLHLHPKKLLNKAHPEYQAKIRGNAFDDEGWLNVLMKNPQLIKGPIAIRNDQAVLCVKPSDILKLEPAEKQIKNRFTSL